MDISIHSSNCLIILATICLTFLSPKIQIVDPSIAWKFLGTVPKQFLEVTIFSPPKPVSNQHLQLPIIIPLVYQISFFHQPSSHKNIKDQKRKIGKYCVSSNGNCITLVLRKSAKSNFPIKSSSTKVPTAKERSTKERTMGKFGK